jgi:hypothetical protein
MRMRVWCKRDSQMLTRADQLCDVAVGSDAARWDLLNGAANCVVKCRGLIGASHDEIKG